MTDIILSKRADGIQIAGTYRYDTWYARGGDDTLNLSWGDDIAYGQAGNDQIFGNVGNDVLYGNLGNDRIIGGLGTDVLYGQRGDDALYEINDDGCYNQVFGGSGNDNITVIGGFIQAGPGNDTIYLDPGTFSHVDVWMGIGQDYVGIWLDQPYADARTTILDFKVEDRVNIDAALPEDQSLRHKEIVAIMDSNDNGWLDEADGLVYDPTTDTSTGVTLHDGDLCLVWQNQEIVFDQLVTVKADWLL